jgi:type II secretory pathway pseudopilin PulG
MRLKKSIITGHGGDTIVEVMIVLAVLGLAISIAYATANRSLLNARQAQETSTATELVQSQVEILRSMAPNLATDATHYVYQTTLFCIDSSSTIQAGFTGTNVYDYSIYPNPPLPAPQQPCVDNNLYHISISWDNATDDTFTVKAIWDDVLGEGQDSVTLIYRVHQQ